MTMQEIKAALQDGKIMVVGKNQDHYKMVDGILCNRLSQASDKSEIWSPIPDPDGVIEHIGNRRGFYKDATFEFKCATQT